MTLKVFMPTANEGWIGDVTISEYKSATRHTIVDTPETADVIWLYSKWIANHYPLPILRTKPCITTVHHIVPDKGIDIAFYDAFTDVYHVPNRFTSDALRKRTEKRSVLLPYWVPTAFNRMSEHELTARFGPPSLHDQFVFGSFQRDTEGSSIHHDEPQPKLEKGPDVLVRVLERFWDEPYKLFLAGWRRQYVKSRVPSSRLVDYTQGMASDSKAFASHAEVNVLYNVLRRHNGIYLVTSRYEGGPQAVLEAAATGCRILSTTMGIAPDVLHPLCVCGAADEPTTIDAFEAKIRSDMPWDDIVAYNAASAERLRLSNVIPSYDDLVEEVYASRG
jgi:glycosyltransferase involved in cell wall biosynthesis